MYEAYRKSNLSTTRKGTLKENINDLIDVGV